MRWRWAFLFVLAFMLVVLTTGSAVPWCAWARTEVPGQKRCCSWHMGVRNCLAGRVVCCDGLFIPTCTC